MEIKDVITGIIFIGFVIYVIFENKIKRYFKKGSTLEDAVPTFDEISNFESSEVKNSSTLTNALTTFDEISDFEESKSKKKS